jgi:TPR repeat protein
LSPQQRQEAEAQRLAEEKRREAESPGVTALAADEGDASAMALLYAHGQNYAKAREWYEKAAAKGNANAMVLLGALYANGQVHGRAGHLAPALQSAERFLRQAHSIDEMVPTYRRLLAS